MNRAEKEPLRSVGIAMDDNTSNSDDDENADAVNGEEGSDQTVTRTVQWRGQ